MALIGLINPIVCDLSAGPVLKFVVPSISKGNSNMLEPELQDLVPNFKDGCGVVLQPGGLAMAESISRA